MRAAAMTGLLAVLTVVVPVRGQQAQNPVNPCDEFCRALRVVLQSGNRGFADITVADAAGSHVAVTAKLPGADKCQIFGQQAGFYTCSFQWEAKADAQRRFTQIARRVAESLPAGWRQEMTGSDAYFFSPDAEPDDYSVKVTLADNQDMVDDLLGRSQQQPRFRVDIIVMPKRQTGGT